MGGVLHEMVFKTIFLMDKMSIQARLAPHQMVVGVKTGAESMIHAGYLMLTMSSIHMSFGRLLFVFLGLEYIRVILLWKPIIIRLSG